MNFFSIVKKTLLKSLNINLDLDKKGDLKPTPVSKPIKENESTNNTIKLDIEKQFDINSKEKSNLTKGKIFFVIFYFIKIQNSNK